jgi:acetylornithine deacetylase
VNAIEKTAILLDAVRRLREEWALRPRHPYLSPADCVPTMIEGGEWIVSYPASCSVTYHVGYLPAHADEDGWGTRVEREIVEWVERAARADPWLAEHPPEFAWAPQVPSSEVPADHPVVEALLAATADLGAPASVGGMENWHDGATFTRFADTPCVCFGPRDMARTHTVDEFVPVDDLVACAQGIAVAAMRFCDVAG